MHAVVRGQRSGVPSEGATGALCLARRHCACKSAQRAVVRAAPGVPETTPGRLSLLPLVRVPARAFLTRPNDSAVVTEWDLLRIGALLVVNAVARCVGRVLVWLTRWVLQ